MAGSFIIIFFALFLFLLFTSQTKAPNSSSKAESDKLSAGRGRSFVSHIENSSQLSNAIDISKKCAMGKYLITTGPEIYFSPDNSVFSSYNHQLAQNLLISAFNVEISNCSNMGPLPQIPTFTIQKVLYGTSALDIKRMFGYLLFSPVHKIAIISFTGTFYTDEWIKDFETQQTEAMLLKGYKPGIKMHKGFYQIYTGQSLVQETSIAETVRSVLKILSPSRIFITGHSLGAGMATVCAFDVANTPNTVVPIVYTFASPRVFNPAGADAFNGIIGNLSYRIFNTSDIVTTVPLPIGIPPNKDIYEHVGIGNGFTNNLGEVWFNHTYAYLHRYGLADKNWMPPA